MTALAIEIHPNLLLLRFVYLDFLQQSGWDYELCCQGAWNQIPVLSLYHMLECRQIT